MNYELAVAERDVPLPAGQELLEVTPILSLDKKYFSSRIEGATVPARKSGAEATDGDNIYKDKTDGCVLYARGQDGTFLRVTEAFNERGTIDISVIDIQTMDQQGVRGSRGLTGSGYMLSLHNGASGEIPFEELRMTGSKYYRQGVSNPAHVRNLMDMLRSGVESEDSTSSEVQRIEELIQAAAHCSEPGKHKAPEPENQQPIITFGEPSPQLQVGGVFVAFVLSASRGLDIPSSEILGNRGRNIDA